MARNFYKQNGSYYYSDNNQKILNVAELQGAAKLGGKEISAPTTPSSPPPTNNTISSNTLSGGINSGGAINNLPNTSATDLAIKSYTDRAGQSGAQTLADNQKQYDQLAAAQLQQTQKDLTNEQANLNNIQTQKQNYYDAQTQPLNDMQQFVTDTTKVKMDAYSNKYDQSYFENQFRQKKELSQSLVDYTKLMDAELKNVDTVSTGLSATHLMGRQNQIKQTYVSKIALAEAALKAIDGNLTLSNDIVNNAADTITKLNNDRLQTLNVVEQLFGAKETDSRNKILTLTAEEKKQIEQAKTDIQSKITAIEENKKFIQSLMTNKDLAPVVAKAGVTLMDTPDQVAQKINAFYKANPNYGNAFNFTTITDADGNQKIVATNKNTGQVLNYSNGDSSTGTGIVEGYDITSYATDPNHEANVKAIYDKLKFNSVAEIDAYIKKYFPSSPITGQMVANASEKYQVSWEILVAMMQQDSSLGTAGKGAKTFNPGNVGNTDSGATKNYGNWQAGVNAVASWLNNHRTSESKSQNNPQQIARDIFSGISTQKLADVSTKNNLRSKVSTELTKLKDEALKNNDILGVMRASAGGNQPSDTFVNNFSKALNVVYQVADLQKSIDKEAIGPIWGTIRSNNPYDTKAQTIKAQLIAIVPNLARGIYGEVGVLTDNDIATYSKTLPNLKSTEDIRKAILGVTIKSVQRSLENQIRVQAGTGRDVSGLINIYEGVRNLADQTLASVGLNTDSNAGRWQQSTGAGRWQQSNNK